MAFADDLIDLVQQLVLQHLRAYKVALPAKVVKYYPETQKVDVQPEPADRDDTEDEDAPFAQILGVRVLWARGGGGSLTFPLKPGDRVDLLVQSAALDNWHASGGQVPQGEPRYGDLSDAVALVGLYPDSEALVSGAASATDAVLEPPAGGVLKLGKSAVKGAARQDDAVDIGALSFTATGNVLTVTYTPPGGSPQLRMLTFTNPSPGSVVVVAAGANPGLAGKITGHSVKTKIE